MSRNLLDSTHPEFPLVQDAIVETVHILRENHEVFGVRLLSTPDADLPCWHISGFVVITTNRETGVKGITEYDIHGEPTRDSLVWEI